jgi:hypothetical protein
MLAPKMNVPPEEGENPSGSFKPAPSGETFHMALQKVEVKLLGL